jgi:hypothetical protein
MTFKYQLIFLGDVENTAYGEIKKRFYELTRQMGMLDEAFVNIFATDFETLYLNKQPSFVFYFGCKDHHDRDKTILEKLMANGDAIIPVFFHDGAFYDEIPEVIQKMNGKQYKTEFVDRFANYALESLRLMRENRKLFISYRRTDSTPVANQLFDAMVRNNYDAFLDAYSIGAARNFQEELHHRLSDCDVLIQLYTENFKNSEWCLEEIVAANQKQIGVVEVVWPGQELDVHNQLCEPIQLKIEDFEGGYKDANSVLTATALNKILIIVESVRARNMAARQDNLVGEFIAEANKYGHIVIQEYKYLVEHLKDGGCRVYIPAVGVPQSYDCYMSLKFRDLLASPSTTTYLIYDDLRIKRDWIKHLDWLNNSTLEVKTIKKNDFASWLQKN